MGMIHKLKKRVFRSVTEGLSFGNQNYTSILSFTIRIIAEALPGTILGHYLDQGLFWTQQQKWMGTSAIPYTLAQIVAWIVIFYSLLHFIPSYAAELTGLSGIFFITLFFLVQTNFVTNLQTVLGMVDKQTDPIFNRASQAIEPTGLAPSPSRGPASPPLRQSGE